MDSNIIVMDVSGQLTRQSMKYNLNNNLLDNLHNGNIIQQQKIVNNPNQSGFMDQLRDDSNVDCNGGGQGDGQGDGPADRKTFYKNYQGNIEKLYKDMRIEPTSKNSVDNQKSLHYNSGLSQTQELTISNPLTSKSSQSRPQQ